MDYTNQHGALRQVGELNDNRQRLLAAKTELDDATKRYQDAKQAYDQAYTALRFFEPDVKERQQAFAKSITSKDYGQLTNFVMEHCSFERKPMMWPSTYIDKETRAPIFDLQPPKSSEGRRFFQERIEEMLVTYNDLYNKPLSFFVSTDKISDKEMMSLVCGEEFTLTKSWRSSVEYEATFKTLPEALDALYQQFV